MYSNISYRINQCKGVLQGPGGTAYVVIPEIVYEDGWHISLGTLKNNVRVLKLTLLNKGGGWRLKVYP